MKKIIIILAIISGLIALFVWLFFASGNNPEENLSKPIKIGEKGNVSFVSNKDKPTGSARSADDAQNPESSESESAEDAVLTEEEKREAAEEKLVDEFDAETDRWMDAEKTKPPTMKEVNAFSEKFKKLPKNRKEECLHRALNLVPDENVMLLVGILMDKSEDKELVELVYNDVLNRDESVKKPILNMIYKDKEHACWADTAWILEVTGELPEKGASK